MNDILKAVNEILGEELVKVQLHNNDTLAKLRYNSDSHDAEFSIIISDNTNVFIHEYVINKRSDEVCEIHTYKNGKGYYFNIHEMSYEALYCVVVKYCEVLKTL